MVKARYQVVFQRPAFKEYSKLPVEIKQRVDEVLDLLSMHPLSPVLRFKKIRGLDNHYRIRIGDYRIIYSPIDTRLVVEVIRLGHRKDVYRFF